METGMVKFFKINEFGGFGFLVLPSGKEIYFQRNDGGLVVAQREPVIETWKQVREPRKGDQIYFFGRVEAPKGIKATPWCFAEDWETAKQEIAQRKTYRLMKTTGSMVSKTTTKTVWEGTIYDGLATILRSKFGSEQIPYTAEHRDGKWTRYHLEVLAENKWEKCENPLAAEDENSSAA